MRRTDLTNDVEGVRYEPEIHRGVGALVLAGSSGRVDADRARVLAEAGVLAESVKWFGGEGQNPGPWEIALELFLGRVENLRRHCDRVLVIGTSFGSEAALLTGALSDEVAAVVAFAPSDVVWAGFADDDRVTSHWTLRGEPLPYLPFVDGWEAEEDPPSFADLYTRSWHEFSGRIPAATIAVERIPEVVLVAGGDDKVWPSVKQAQRIRERRDSYGLSTTVVSDPDAGHRTILPGEATQGGGIRMRRGGTEQADRRLGQLAWDHIRRLM